MASVVWYTHSSVSAIMRSLKVHMLAILALLVLVAAHTQHMRTDPQGTCAQLNDCLFERGVESCWCGHGEPVVVPLHKHSHPYAGLLARSLTTTQLGVLFSTPFAASTVALEEDVDIDGPQDAVQATAGATQADVETEEKKSGAPGKGGDDDDDEAATAAAEAKAAAAKAKAAAEAAQAAKVKAAVAKLVEQQVAAADKVKAAIAATKAAADQQIKALIAAKAAKDTQGVAAAQVRAALAAVAKANSAAAKQSDAVASNPAVKKQLTAIEKMQASLNAASKQAQINVTKTKFKTCEVVPLKVCWCWNPTRCWSWF
jgi:hypothetical protein